MRKILCFVLIIIMYSNQYAQRLSPKEREILQLQDRRALGEGKLINYLTDQDARLRYRAALALANIQHPATVQALILSLNDRNKNVRSAAAFALGQIGSQQAQEALLSAVSNEKNATVLSYILEAIGKSCSMHGLDVLLLNGTVKTTKLPEKDLARCIAHFAIRQFKSERSIWKCFELLRHKSPEIRSMALYALWRAAPYELIDLEISRNNEILIRLAKDRDPMVRMHLATLLAKSNSKDIPNIMDRCEQAEQKMNDWHVWVQIVRARASLAKSDKKILTRYLTYLRMANNHVKITALQSLRMIPSEVIFQSDSVEAIHQIISGYVDFQSEETEAVRGEAFVTLGKHFPNDLSQFYSWIVDTNGTPRLKAKLLEGIAQQITREHMNILLAQLNHESTRVSMAAWDFIKPMLISVPDSSLYLDSTAESNLLGTVLKHASMALVRKDIGLTTVIAHLFADTACANNFREYGFQDKIVEILISAFENLKNPDDMEAKQSIIQALENVVNTQVEAFLERVISDRDYTVACEAVASLNRLTGKNYSDRLPKYTIPLKTDEEWNLLENIQPQQKVRITTNQGDIIMLLMKEHAPFTVLNFVKLINVNFYDNFCFHRVIPNFVVQGGDPRGDGWGGPGYTMRTEVSLVHFTRGSCGMASAGRDTEGCQFFITHLPTPHLDGRYTVFAQIVAGTEVVDRLQAGDTIRSIRLMQ